ncbi:MAG: hypothetical protein U9R01_08215 [candidate division WOR-3 bacterium]|nr:hypothetical protein [candidate division WOR-3 bacterium]
MKGIERTDTNFLNLSFNMKNRKIKFDLITNAQDSLYHAVEHLTNINGPTVGDLKRAILDVAHVVELILKERLKRIHPAFIWQNVDKYPSTEALTISTNVAVKRLFNIGGISLSNSDIKTISACRKLRNRIEHFEFEIELAKAKAIVGRMLSFIFNFSKYNLGLDLETEFKQDDQWSELIDIYEFWEAHSKALENQLLDEGKPICECPLCGAQTFDLTVMKCALCDHSDEEVECDVCHETVWESNTEIVERIPGSRLIVCGKCLYGDDYLDFAVDLLRDRELEEKNE